MSFLIGHYSLYADPISIESIDKVEECVRTLRTSGIKPGEIGIILDFHGVVTDQPHHKSVLTLKGNIKRVLNYFLEEGVGVTLATAWLNFTEFVEGVKSLGLSDYFGIDGDLESHSEKYLVGEENSLIVEGYKNGRAVALKYAEDKGRDPFFRQKVHALEVTHPGQVFKYVIAVDDDKGNLKIIESNFPSTVYAGHGCELILFHLTLKEESSPIVRRWVEGPPSPVFERHCLSSTLLIGGLPVSNSKGQDNEVSPRSPENESHDESDEFIGLKEDGI